MKGEWVVDDGCEHEWYFDYTSDEGIIYKICHWCKVKQHPEI